MNYKNAHRRHQAGFTLFEMLVAIAMFVLIGGAAFMLAGKHAKMFSTQQTQVGLTTALRNAAAQMQIDVVNAGNGFYTQADIPGWPIGVTINNQSPTDTCYDATTHAYTETCFDTLNVITTDLNTPPAHPTDSGANCVSTTSSSLFATPVAPTTVDQQAGYYKNGDFVLLVKSDGSQMTTTKLTDNASTPGGKVKLPHNPTGANGVNNASDDPFLISLASENNKLGEQFCSDDWLLKLSPVTYKVDASDPTNPKLLRQPYGADCSGNKCVLAEQVIGFKIGAAVVGSANDQKYSYDPAKDYNSDYTRVRALRITIIARTDPRGDGTGFHNSFDGGAYRIQSISFVINPRNLSMKDQ